MTLKREHQTYQPNITQVKQAEGFGALCLCLNEVLENVSGGGLDVAIILGNRNQGPNSVEWKGSGGEAGFERKNLPS